jgi:hypothetical protein
VTEYFSFTVWILGHLLIHDLKLRCRGFTLTYHRIKNYIIYILLIIHKLHYYQFYCRDLLFLYGIRYAKNRSFKITGLCVVTS